MAEAMNKMIKISAEKFNCVVCLQTLYDPKDLPCRHSVCNDCLDGLVYFQEVGSGTLQCPHGCDGIIKIDANDTVHSMLSLNYVTQDLLSCIKETNDIDLSLCQDVGSNCDEIACNSCSKCSKKTCTSCWDVHDCENKTSTPVIFDERKQSFEAFCNLHGAHARSICMDCGNQFICVYCYNRLHQTHMKETIENHAVVLKNTLSVEYENKRKERIPTISYKEELKNITEQRVNLVNELQERTVKRLSHYAKSLDHQRDTLLQKFDANVREYERKLTKLGLEENNEEAFSSYMDQLDTKPFFEILSEKDEIMQKSEILASTHCFVASLTDDDKEHTLGDLYVTTCMKNEMHEDDKVVDVIYKKSYKTDEECVDDLDDLTKSITDLDKNVIPVQSTKQVVRDVKRKKYSFNDVVQLIEGDQINELKVLLKYKPDVIHSKNLFKQTLIYKASSLDKHESLRLLLDTNIDNINTSSKSFSPLTVASNNGHIQCVDLLLQCHCDINMPDTWRDTALMCASENGRVDCVRLLLANNADINIKNKIGETAKDLASSDEIKQIMTTYANKRI